MFLAVHGQLKMQEGSGECRAYIALMKMDEALDCDSSHIQVLAGLSKIFANQSFKKKIDIGVHYILTSYVAS